MIVLPLGFLSMLNDVFVEGCVYLILDVEVAIHNFVGLWNGMEFLMYVF